MWCVLFTWDERPELSWKAVEGVPKKIPKRRRKVEPVTKRQFVEAESEADVWKALVSHYNSDDVFSRPDRMFLLHSKITLFRVRRDPGNAREIPPPVPFDKNHPLMKEIERSLVRGRHQLDKQLLIERVYPEAERETHLAQAKRIRLEYTQQKYGS